MFREEGRKELKDRIKAKKKEGEVLEEKRRGEVKQYNKKGSRTLLMANNSNQTDLTNESVNKHRCKKNCLK